MAVVLVVLVGAGGGYCGSGGVCGGGGSGRGCGVSGGGTAMIAVMVKCQV